MQHWFVFSKEMGQKVSCTKFWGPERPQMIQKHRKSQLSRHQEMPASAKCIVEDGDATEAPTAATREISPVDWREWGHGWAAYIRGGCSTPLNIKRKPRVYAKMFDLTFGGKAKDLPPQTQVVLYQNPWYHEGFAVRKRIYLSQKDWRSTDHSRHQVGVSRIWVSTKLGTIFHTWENRG